MQTSTPPGPSAAGSITLTQVLALDRRVVIYGIRITDLSPRGDLGLGLDPEGPVGFALVHGFSRNGQFTRLATPMVLSVYGEGRACDPAEHDGGPGQRAWPVALADRALRLEMQQGSIAALLDAC